MPCDGFQLSASGFAWGKGRQPLLPFTNNDYSYKVTNYSFLINFKLREFRHCNLELQLEPAFHSVKYKLNNEYFIQPATSPDYLRLREKYSRERTYGEYGVNINFSLRYFLNPHLSVFALMGVGPVYSETETERLAGGFAFSDIVALGLAYKTGRVSFELRPALRHVSNANLKKPNSGHNSTNIDFGILYSLR